MPGSLPGMDVDSILSPIVFKNNAAICGSNCVPALFWISAKAIGEANWFLNGRVTTRSVIPECINRESKSFLIYFRPLIDTFRGDD